MYPTNNNNKQTPLEKLISEKEQVRLRCQYQEQRLNGHMVYIQQNAGGLLLSGLTSILFPKQKPSSPVKSAVQQEKLAAQTVSPGLSDYLSIAKAMMPALWDVAKPLLISWGMNKAGSLFFKLLRKK